MFSKNWVKRGTQKITLLVYLSATYMVPSHILLYIFTAINTADKKVVKAQAVLYSALCIINKIDS